MAEPERRKWGSGCPGDRAATVLRVLGYRGKDSRPLVHRSIAVLVHSSVVELGAGALRIDYDRTTAFSECIIVSTVLDGGG